MALNGGFYVNVLAEVAFYSPCTAKLESSLSQFKQQFF